MNVLSAYFNWLQKDNPTGTVDRFPELAGRFETSVPGIYCIGDLTGVPLIKLAAESGHDLVEQLAKDPGFKKEREKKPQGMLDLVIVGAGPAGLAAAAKAVKEGLDILVLEASRVLNTLENFPAGKPIYVTPKDTPCRSSLSFTDGTKETLLPELKSCLDFSSLPLEEDRKVEKIVKQGASFTVETKNANHECLRVVVAIGKTGNARQLGVPGQDLPKVFTRLIDPSEHHDQDILVVGGGDSAIEAANALAEKGNRVVLSYRKEKLSRPKEHNIQAFENLVAQQKIIPLLGSSVEKIENDSVVLNTPDGSKTIDNQVIYALIGTEIPIQFFNRSNIRMEGEKNYSYWVFLTAMVSFFCMVYFGKSGFATPVFEPGTPLFGKLGAYLGAPFSATYDWGAKGYAWLSSLNFVLGWAGSIVFVLSGALSLAIIAAQKDHYFKNTWSLVKISYLTLGALLFTWVYFTAIFNTDSGWVEAPTYWFSFLYCTTMVVFGIRRIQLKPTAYIVYQTGLLIFVQVFFLFLLPFHLYDPFIATRVSADSVWLQELFPQGKWSSFGFILFWPLNINNFGTSTFWTWFPFVQTFGLLLLIVYKWGKGAYCGWICSCGGMAETLGDEYRTRTPHGPGEKKLENIGQVLLAFAFIATFLHYGAAHWLPQGTLLADTAWGFYKLSVDIVFAGVLGLGVYFFLGGRIWCRFGCPLAALMHIYTRFSPYRIMTNKKRCISCNICTKVCHMGIDVMGFANKGIPMNDAQCVRCSACVVNCPMQALTFGRVDGPDPSNLSYQAKSYPLQKGWASGLMKDDIAMLLEEEKQKPA